MKLENAKHLTLSDSSPLTAIQSASMPQNIVNLHQKLREKELLRQKQKLQYIHSKQTKLNEVEAIMNRHLKLKVLQKGNIMEKANEHHRLLL